MTNNILSSSSVGRTEKLNGPELAPGCSLLMPDAGSLRLKEIGHDHATFFFFQFLNATCWRCLKKTEWESCQCSCIPDNNTSGNTFSSRHPILPSLRREREPLSPGASKRRGSERLDFIFGGDSAETLWFMHAVSEQLASHEGGWRRRGPRERSQKWGKNSGAQTRSPTGPRKQTLLWLLLLILAECCCCLLVCGSFGPCVTVNRLYGQFRQLKACGLLPEEQK